MQTRIRTAGGGFFQGGEAAVGSFVSGTALDIFPCRVCRCFVDRMFRENDVFSPAKLLKRRMTMDTLTIQTSRISLARRLLRAVLIGAKALGHLLPIASNRQGFKRLVDYYESAAVRRTRSGDDAGARYYAAHAAAMQNAITSRQTSFR